MTTGRKKNPRCIVCGRAIAKLTDLIEFRPHDQDAPRSREQCSLRTNQQVLRVRFRHDGRVADFTVWDGQSYVSSYFCTNRCAVQQGYASAANGDRFIWKRD